jgi:hypothetical protein
MQVGNDKRCSLIVARNAPQSLLSPASCLNTPTYIHVRGTDSAELSLPRELFALPNGLTGLGPFEVAADGQRFLVQVTVDKIEPLTANRLATPPRSVSRSQISGPPDIPRVAATRWPSDESRKVMYSPSSLRRQIAEVARSGIGLAGATNRASGPPSERISDPQIPLTRQKFRLIASPR